MRDGEGAANSIVRPRPVVGAVCGGHIFEARRPRRPLAPVHHLAGVLLAWVRAVSPAKADAARELAYRFYTLCECKKRAQEALAYNSLVVAWPELVRLRDGAPVAPTLRTTELF